MEVTEKDVFALMLENAEKRTKLDVELTEYIKQAQKKFDLLEVEDNGDNGENEND